MIKNNANAKQPETIGDKSHETTIAVTPLTYGNSVLFSVQMTHFWPLVTMVIPTMPPTHECVVETGISRYEAKSNQIEVAAKTHMQPYIKIAGSLVKQLKSEILPRMASVTCEPMNKAPVNSQTAASIIAILIVTAPDPTEVANAFATSFAPIPNAVIKHKNAPRTTTVFNNNNNNHHYLDEEEEDHC